jgi:hypothetical protein
MRRIGVLTPMAAGPPWRGRKAITMPTDRIPVSVAGAMYVVNTGLIMVYWIRRFRNRHSGETFEVTSDEQYLPSLRRRIVIECGREPDWENESIYEHESGLDMKLEGDYQQIDIKGD